MRIPDHQEVLDRHCDTDSLRNEQDARTRLLGDELRKMMRHRLEVMGHKYPVLRSALLEDRLVRLSQYSCLWSSSEIDGRLAAQYTVNYRLVQVLVSLETNFHAFLLSCSCRIRSSFFCSSALRGS